MCFTIFQNEKTPSQAIKTASSKSGKIEIFAKGLTHGFGPKLAISQSFIFQALSDRKMCFTIFQNEKTPFQAIKTASSKSGNIAIFSTGLTYGFGPKLAIFPSFFQAIQARKKCFTIFQKEKTPLQAIKARSSKSRKIEIFAKGLTHGFGAKLTISPSVVFSQYRAGNVFYDILERKNAFLGYKNSEFKKWKNCDFFNGANPWFWSKIGHFSTFFFRQYRPGKSVLRYSRTKKKSVLGYKNSKFIKWKNSDFCKGVNSWFWFNIRHFSMFCFQAIQARKKCLRYSRTEKMLFEVLKTRSLKSRKIEIFAKGLTHGFGLKLAIFPSFFF